MAANPRTLELGPGADLSGQSLSHLDLRGVDLSSANLSGAHLSHVDLSGASLEGVILRDATLRWVEARRVRMAGADCTSSFWEHVDAQSADLTGVDARSALFAQCDLRRATLRSAVLTLTRLAACRCDHADLTGATLGRVTTVGSDFEAACFDGASAFAESREIVVEILSREVHDDPERAMLVGAAAIVRTWCYDEWASRLRERPDLVREAITIFARYPDSGFADALRQALGRSPA